MSTILRHKLVSREDSMISHRWTFAERVYMIPSAYFDKAHTQGDSMVRTKKWTIKNFNLMVKS